MGGSTAWTTKTSTMNSGLLFSYATYAPDRNSFWTINGTSTSTYAFKSGVVYNDAWMTSTLRVKWEGNRRVATLYHGSNNNCENQRDVTSWTPGGTYITVGAHTGASNAEHYVNHVCLQYA